MFKWETNYDLFGFFSYKWWLLPHLSRKPVGMICKDTFRYSCYFQHKFVAYADDLEEAMRIIEAMY
jgi:hypothetical protein